MENPYLMDGFPKPLCAMCFDWYYEGGGPYKPDAIDRSAQYLDKMFRAHAIPSNALLTVAGFLHEWTEP